MSDQTPVRYATAFVDAGPIQIQWITRDGANVGETKVEPPLQVAAPLPARVPVPREHLHGAYSGLIGWWGRDADIAKLEAAYDALAAQLEQAQKVQHILVTGPNGEKVADDCALRGCQVLDHETVIAISDLRAERDALAAQLAELRKKVGVLMSDQAPIKVDVSKEWCEKGYVVTIARFKT